jgi:hypothetical protein
VRHPFFKEKLYIGQQSSYIVCVIFPLVTIPSNEIFETEQTNKKPKEEQQNILKKEGNNLTDHT